MLPDVGLHGINNLDFGVFKNNRFGSDGRYNVQFRSEFFNVANHVRSASLAWRWVNANFGVINGQANNPRHIQLG
jgi:hypothetical protein